MFSSVSSGEPSSGSRMVSQRIRVQRGRARADEQANPQGDPWLCAAAPGLPVRRRRPSPPSSAWPERPSVGLVVVRVSSVKLVRVDGRPRAGPRCRADVGVGLGLAVAQLDPPGRRRRGRAGRSRGRRSRSWRTPWFRQGFLVCSSGVDADLDQAGVQRRGQGVIIAQNRHCRDMGRRAVEVHAGEEAQAGPADTTGHRVVATPAGSSVT